MVIELMFGAAVSADHLSRTRAARRRPPRAQRWRPAVTPSSSCWAGRPTLTTWLSTRRTSRQGPAHSAASGPCRCTSTRNYSKGAPGVLAACEARRENSKRWYCNLNLACVALN
eukprot:scaffold51383_cov29-Prasinocladus_malaysianus.AAC.1